MKYLAIDLGTYSIKTMLVRLDRKQMTLLDSSEFILEDLKAEMDPEGDDHSLKKVLLQNIVPEDFDGKVIYQVPNQMVTSRHLELPVTQRKKVEMMIPFQLDELLPYPSHNAHYFSQQIKKENNTSALVNVTKKSEFEEYFNYYEEVLPSVLTTELGTIHAHAQNKELRGPMAILDIGHRTSKCYIIYKGEVISHHFSFCAGASIDEVISETYNIPLKDAITYKHQNCFLLTDGQYDEVSEDQKEFALLMKKTMMPLVLEVKRWLLGFRVKYGMPVEQLLICGGSSNIHNINNFFAQKVEIPTDFTVLSESLLDSEEQLVGKECTFYLSGLMAINLSQRNKPGNFLQGDFSNGSSLTLPLYSAAFVAQRTLIAAVLFSLILGVDIFFQQSKQKKLDRNLRAILKQKELDISASQRRRLDRYLEPIAKKLNRQNEALEKELNALKSSGNSNALNPLFELFSLVQSKKSYELTQFESDGEKTNGAFKAMDENAVSEIKTILENSGLNGLKVNTKGSLVNFSFFKGGN